MNRMMRPVVEPLEGKALLSALPAGLVASIATDRASYRVGQPVAVTRTVTNASGHDVTVEHGPANEGFTASRAGQPAWESNAGVQAEFLRSDVLRPGQSLTIQRVWDGRSDLLDPGNPCVEGPPLRGTFAIRSQMDPAGPPAIVTIGAPHVAPPVPKAHPRPPSTRPAGPA